MRCICLAMYCIVSLDTVQYIILMKKAICHDKLKYSCVDLTLSVCYDSPVLSSTGK